MYQRILVPINVEESCESVFKEALALATALKACVCVLHIVDASQFAEDPVALAHELRLGDVEREHDARHVELRRSLDAQAGVFLAAGIETDVRLVEKFGGKISEAILKAATDWEADLIVMATHGRSGLRHLLMGSVAEGVVHQARIPVLLVHDSSEEE